jgi:hypothetical protein
MRQKRRSTAAFQNVAVLIMLHLALALWSAALLHRFRNNAADRLGDVFT